MDPLLLTIPADDVFVTQRGIATIIKDARASREYGLDLTAWLAEIDDTIQSAEVTLTGIDPVELDTSSNPVVHLSGDTSGYQKISVWLSGGSPVFAEAVFFFTTVGGRSDVRRIRFIVRER